MPRSRRRSTARRGAFAARASATIVLLGDHGGYAKALQAVAAKLNREWAATPVRVLVPAEYYRAAEQGFAATLTARGYRADEIGTHAGLADTSLALALTPALVRGERLREAPSAKDGAYGDPRRSSAELGALGADAIVARHRRCDPQGDRTSLKSPHTSPKFHHVDRTARLRLRLAAAAAARDRRCRSAAGARRHRRRRRPAVDDGAGDAAGPRRGQSLQRDRGRQVSAAVAGDLPRVYVPNLQSNDVYVIDPATLKVVDKFRVGINPQHVVPSWDLRTLWVTNNAEGRTDGSLTPIDPKTGKPGKAIAVDDPYNMYFTPDGKSAIVVAEAMKRLDFRDPKTMALQYSIDVPQCAGINHADFSIDGRSRSSPASSTGTVAKVDLVNRKVLGYTQVIQPGRPTKVVKGPDGRDEVICTTSGRACRRTSAPRPTASCSTSPT